MGVTSLDMVLLQVQLGYTDSAPVTCACMGCVRSTEQCFLARPAVQWEEPLDARSPRKAGLVDAALWLSDLQSQGLIRAIGVANFDTPHLLDVSAKKALSH